MTVAQLIDILREHDEGGIVLVDGYEGGLCEVVESNVYRTRYNRNPGESAYLGEYDPHEEGRSLGVVIGRKPGWLPSACSERFDSAIHRCRLKMDEIQRVQNPDRRLLKIAMESIAANLRIAFTTGYRTGEQKESYQDVRAAFFVLQKRHEIFYDNDEF